MIDNNQIKISNSNQNVIKKIRINVFDSSVVNR